MVDYCLMSIFDSATPLRPRGLQIVRIFLVPDVLLRCGGAKKLLCAQLCLFAVVTDVADLSNRNVRRLPFSDLLDKS